MRFSIDGSVLKKLSRILGSVRNTDCAVAVSAERVSAGGGSVTLRTMEDVKLVTLSVSADVPESGQATFPSRYLRLFEDQAGPVRFETARTGGLAIRGASTYAIPDYPGEPLQDPRRQPAGSATFDLHEVKRMLRRVVFASGGEEQYNLDCVLLECRGSSIRASSCDRRILAQATMPKGSPFQGSFLLHKSAAGVISRLDGDLVTVTFYDSALQFSVSGEIMCDILTPEFTTAFPSFDAALAVETLTELHGDTERLMRAVADVRKLSNELTIHLSCHHQGYVKQKPRLSGREENGSSTVEAVADLAWEGAEIRVKVNARTFESALAQCGERVRVSFSSACGPLFVRDEDDEFLCVMMPYTVAERR